MMKGKLNEKKAELVNGVPRKTVTGHMNEMVTNPGSLGRYTCSLGGSHENALVEHIVKFQQMLHGFTTIEFRKLSFKIAEKIGIDHPFSKKYKKAGRVKCLLEKAL